MSRTRTSTALLLLASMALATACTRSDPMAPSDTPQLAHGEHQGADN